MRSQSYRLTGFSFSVDVETDVVDFQAGVPLEHDTVIGSRSSERSELTRRRRPGSLKCPLRKATGNCLRPVRSGITRTRARRGPRAACFFPQLKTTGRA